MIPSGISNYQLSLKIGAPVMLLRNLQAGPKISLRNGTRMIVIQMMERAIEVEVAVGMNKGLRVFLPRVPQYDKSGDYPFTLVRRQYPVRLCHNQQGTRPRKWKSWVGLTCTSVFTWTALHRNVSRKEGLNGKTEDCWQWWRTDWEHCLPRVTQLGNLKQSCRYTRMR